MAENRPIRRWTRNKEKNADPCGRICTTATMLRRLVAATGGSRRTRPHPTRCPKTRRRLKPELQRDTQRTSADAPKLPNLPGAKTSVKEHKMISDNSVRHGPVHAPAPRNRAGGACEGRCVAGSGLQAHCSPLKARCPLLQAPCSPLQVGRHGGAWRADVRAAALLHQPRDRVAPSSRGTRFPSRYPIMTYVIRPLAAPPHQHQGAVH